VVAALMTYLLFVAVRDYGIVRALVNWLNEKRFFSDFWDHMALKHCLLGVRF